MSILTLAASDHTIPVDDDGEPFPFALALPDRTVFSTTCTELVAELIDNYPEDENEALLVRADHAIAAATEVQAMLAAEAVEQGGFDPSEHSETALTILLGDRNQPVSLASWPLEDGPDVPLVLVATDYAPYTDLPAPAGDVFFIDPGDESSFLRSLSSVGLIAFAPHTQA